MSSCSIQARVNGGLDREEMAGDWLQPEEIDLSEKTAQESQD